MGEPVGGREQLAFRSGDVAVLPDPARALDEEALVPVGRLLRPAA
ncbi:hypothetical protein [Kitasatospora griseola]